MDNGSQQGGGIALYFPFGLKVLGILTDAVATMSQCSKAAQVTIRMPRYF